MTELPEHINSKPPGNVIKNTGAVIAVLLGIPCFFIGLFGAAGVLMIEKLVAGSLGAAWGYMAVAGAYELNRRKFGWKRGSKYSDQHLLAGTLAVAVGLIVSGAIHETMPALAIVPALSAIMQASDGHKNHYLSLLHAAVLAVGVSVGIWFYADGVIGRVLLDKFETLP